MSKEISINQRVKKIANKLVRLDRKLQRRKAILIKNPILREEILREISEEVNKANRELALIIEEVIR